MEVGRCGFVISTFCFAFFSGEGRVNTIYSSVLLCIILLESILCPNCWLAWTVIGDGVVFLEADTLPQGVAWPVAPNTRKPARH